jgi:hypothetical protein
VNGDSLYLITVTSGPTTEAYKVWIQRYDSDPADSIHWEFRIAKFDGTEDTTIFIYRKPNYTDRLFAYYNVNTRMFSDREPGRTAWDLLFTRYKEYLAGAPGVPYYSVMGVLSNFDVTVAQRQQIGEDDTAGHSGYSFTTRMNEIGSDWKVFDMNLTPPAFVIDDSTYYFIKTKNTSEYYQLQFTGFGGAATGKVLFRKRHLSDVLSINNIGTPLSAYHLAPNPANNEVNILIDTKEEVKSAQLIVTDLTGKVVYRTGVSVNSGMNAYRVSTASLTSGMYFVVLTNGSWKAAEKLVVQH